jgi:hypothetical protein
MPEGLHEWGVQLGAGGWVGTVRVQDCTHQTAADVCVL